MHKESILKLDKKIKMEEFCVKHETDFCYCSECKGFKKIIEDIPIEFYNDDGKLIGPFPPRNYSLATLSDSKLYQGPFLSTLRKEPFIELCQLQDIFMYDMPYGYFVAKEFFCLFTIPMLLKYYDRCAIVNKFRKFIIDEELVRRLSKKKRKIVDDYFKSRLEDLLYDLVLLPVSSFDLWDGIRKPSVKLYCALNSSKLYKGPILIDKTRKFGWNLVAKIVKKIEKEFHKLINSYMTVKDVNKIIFSYLYVYHVKYYDD